MDPTVTTPVVGFLDPGSLLPLFPGQQCPTREPQLAYMTAWSSVTRKSTVSLASSGGGGGALVDLPVLSGAEGTLVAGATVLLIPLGPTWLIVGRVRVPS